MSALGSSIRSRLVRLVLVATLPLLLFSAVLLQRSYRVSVGLVEDNALGTARRIAAALDAQIGRAQAVGYVLAELPPKDLADVGEFEEAASRALTAAGLDGVLKVIDRDGAVIAHTLGADPDLLGRTETMDQVRRLFETGVPQVSGPFSAPGTPEKQVAVHVPLVGDGAVRYDVAVLLSARSIGAQAAQMAPGAGWFALICDASGQLVANVSEPDQAPAGAQDGVAPSGLLALASGRTEGVGAARIGMDATALVGFAHSERTGWLVGVGVPAGIVRDPALRSIGALAAGAAAVLLASLSLAWLLGRNVSRPLSLLAAQAGRLGRNERPDPRVGRGLAEAEAVAQAMHNASLALAARQDERAAALQRAEASEARLLLAQDIGAVGTWEIDLRSDRRSWSRQQFLLYGRDPDQGAPDEQAWIGLLHPDDRDRAATLHRQAIETVSSFEQMFRVTRPDGEERWLHAAGRSEFEAGAPVRLVGITLDVTDRQLAERRLRDSAARLEGEIAARTAELADSEARFRAYFQQSSDALIVVRAEGDQFVYETINPAGERLFGVRAADLLERPAGDVLPRETVAAVLAGYRKVVERGKPLTLERTMLLPAGLLQLETVLTPVPGSGTTATGERVLRIISGSRDLTERKRVEGRLAHAQRMEAVGQLTGGVAHDFNNLLTVVVGNLSLLRRRIGNDDPRIQRYLASVEAAAERGARLTASLLAFSRRQTLQVERVDLATRLHDSTTLLQRALGEQIELTLRIEPGLPPASADAGQLEAAVLNLVINARDAIQEQARLHGGSGGTLLIAAREAELRASELEGNDEAKPGRFLAVSVQDCGTGMPAAVRARAFEPFFTTKEIGRGTGLGLSQVFGFVRQLGGHVTLDSVAGRGTTVTMFLPASGDPVAMPAEPAEPKPLPHGKTVLIVEDDRNIRDLTAEMLRDAGLLVLTAESSPAALEILRSVTLVDLLFSDIVLPGGATGVELAQAARALRPHVAVLLTSGYSGAALVELGADAAYEVLTKPYSRSHLIERIGATFDAAPLPVG